MTLRAWVEASIGTVGTRAELEQFETEYLSSLHRAAEAGGPEAIVLEAPPAAWLFGFLHARVLFRLAARLADVMGTER